ncbi:MAG: ATPase [Candidatus Moranbacteria bacterium]|nr:ATPase [Candidatus Moranbacteria bacterium]
MAQVGIREFDGKNIIKQAANNNKAPLKIKSLLYKAGDSFLKLEKKHPFLKKEKLIVKPDQLFGRRGKYGLVGLNLDWPEVKKWIKQKSQKPFLINKAKDRLQYFIIEPFVKHKKEFYLSIETKRDFDQINFSYQGGIEIEKNWDKVIQIKADLLKGLKNSDLEKALKKDRNFEALKNFIAFIYKIFIDFNFTFLEINPFTIKKGVVYPLDVVLKVDDAAFWENSEIYQNIEIPVPFGRKISKEEQKIIRLDKKTGASLKLIVLNPKGRVWTMVAGGGASVIYTDTISDLGFGKELANYGEYSGDPSTLETYQYAKTILELMLKEKSPQGKILIIGGGIANFTDVAATFTGIIMALEEFREKIKQNKIKIFVRRGGPNYKEGLKKMKKAGEDFKIPIQVYGPQTHMTEVVNLALKNL